MSAGGPHIDATHDPDVCSWVESANAEGCDFPIQNLPFGHFREQDDPDWRIGAAIGDQVLDLRRAGLINHADINRLMRLLPDVRREFRQALHTGLRADSVHVNRLKPALIPMRRVQMGVPCHVGDYTDFYIGIHHATAVGRLFRPDNPLLPNYKWVPIGYHGRASTILLSGQSFTRPVGQIKSAAAEAPVLRPSQRLDYELELGIVIGRPNPLGQPIPKEQAEDHVFGVTLFNDWSARDIQAWEYQPLGPFLSKNFASTISPWIVTMDALAPFRRAFVRPDGDPAPLPYLDSAQNRAHGALDIHLEVALQTASMRAAGQPAQCIAQSNFPDAAYWTVAQLVAHHTVNGCTLSNGDLFGTGTLSGTQASQAGSLLELTQGGSKSIELGNGELRTFLQDGDGVSLRGFCEREGFRRIGFGECFAVVAPAASEP